MSVRALGAVWRVECAPLHKFLLLALADHANDETFDCWPSLTHLAKKTGMNRSTITRTLNALEEAGFIAREQREKTSTRYVLNVASWVRTAPSRTEHLGAESATTRCTQRQEVGAQSTHKHQSNHQGTVNQLQGDLERPQTEKIPYDEIVSIYHELLPMCPPVRKLTEARKKQIRARWRDGDLPDLNTWRDYFRYVAKSKFLTGLAPPGIGRSKPFIATMEWLTTEGHYAKVFEQFYHR